MTPRTVWLASYPKSGNTWVRAMVAALDRGHADINSNIRNSVIASGRAPLERLTGLVSSELLDEEVDRLRPLVDLQLDRMHSQADGFWHRKIHDALFTKDGAPIVSPEATRAAIYLVRDPRDVAVSYSHHTGNDIAKIVRSMASPSARFSGYHLQVSTQVGQHAGTWSSHVESWLDHELFPVVFVRYEDMLADPAAQLARIAHTLGRRGDERPARGGGRGHDLRQAQEPGDRVRLPRVPEPRSPVFRRGIAGASRSRLSPELATPVVGPTTDTSSLAWDTSQRQACRYAQRTQRPRHRGRLRPSQLSRKWTA